LPGPGWLTSAPSHLWRYILDDGIGVYLPITVVGMLSISPPFPFNGNPTPEPHIHTVGEVKIWLKDEQLM
jgi:hypothetical protein